MTRNSQDKLNAFHVSGSVGIAAVLAAICNSLPLFFLVAGALIAASVFTGEVRLPKQRSGKSRR
ncbi:MAG: hypothetical protein KF777_24805 [Planctomycetaceae bacterium]|nr:hypothetical protein [Planctomycetaceae bacterium]